MIEPIESLQLLSVHLKKIAPNTIQLQTEDDDSMSLAASLEE
jgi:hypothetical protein